MDEEGDSSLRLNESKNTLDISHLGGKPFIPVRGTRLELYCGDSQQVLSEILDESVDLIITSPPYADQRETTYGGIKPDWYVAWFMPIADQLFRVLAPSGSFVLNIKERVVNGERHTYVMELILEMRRRGWYFTEEYIWHKKNCYPGKWPNRFRDAWERCIHFTKQKKFAMYQEAVMVPMGEWRHGRLRSLSATDKQRDESRAGSGFGKKVENWLGRDKAYPTNVLHLATECGNRQHPAVFPESLPDWFIRLFTQAGNVVLDPFSGSGSSLRAANRLARHSIGIDASRIYCEQTAQDLGLRWEEDKSKMGGGAWRN